MEKVGFFEEKAGVKSMTRLSSFILLWFFLILNVLYFIGGGKIDYNFITFDLMLLVGVFVPKVLQKMVEARGPELTKK